MIKEYVSPPHESDKPKYILQNPVGKVFYMEKLSEEGEKRVDYENKMQANIKTPNKPAVNNITENSAIIDGGSGTEVRIGEGAWHDSPHTFINLNEDTSYTAYSRYKKTDTHYASNVSEGFNFMTDASSLYEFTSATFTNAGATGRFGPTQSQLNNTYRNTEVEGHVVSDSGIQLWTIPKSGMYRIEAYGAQGGSSGGRGAIMQGEFSLKSEDKIKILVGQVGANVGYYEGSGGGGGSFVWRATSDTPLIVAGGGGGIGIYGGSASLPTEIPIKEGYKFLGWEAVEIEGVKQNLSIMSRWKMMTEDDYLATDADFSGNANGEFKYIGNEKIVKIPHKIKGVNITSYKEMFKGTSVEKVISDNINITTLDQMFSYTNSNFLDVSQLDTRNVTNFGMLFSNSKAKKIIGLNKLNTSKVTTMYNMFANISVESLDLSNFDTRKVDPSAFGFHFMFNGTKVETLDLSSFDTSRFSKLPIMFNGAEVTNAYARNQTEANKFNATEYNTIKTRFIVKP